MVSGLKEWILPLEYAKPSKLSGHTQSVSYCGVINAMADRINRHSN